MDKIKIRFTAEIEVDNIIPFAGPPLDEQRENLQRVLYDRLLDKDPHTRVRVTDYKMSREVI